MSFVDLFQKKKNKLHETKKFLQQESKIKRHIEFFCKIFEGGTTFHSSYVSIRIRSLYILDLRSMGRNGKLHVHSNSAVI